MNEWRWCETLVGLCERVCWQSDLAWCRSLGWDSFWWSPRGKFDWISPNTGCWFGLVCWHFLRRPWNPLSCNHITIHIRRREDLLLQQTGGWVFFSLAHVVISVGLDNQRVTYWGQKSPFTLGKPWAAKSLNSITKIASANTYRHTNSTHPHTL